MFLIVTGRSLSPAQCFSHRGRADPPGEFGKLLVLCASRWLSASVFVDQVIHSGMMCPAGNPDGRRNAAVHTTRALPAELLVRERV